MSDTERAAEKPQGESRLSLYCRLLRLDKPEGTLLLLWPTLSALWLASNGVPSLKHLAVFILGTVFMRSAGCAVNDYADRDFDKQVRRTASRPLASGLIRPAEALAAAGVLALASFVLVLFLNRLTVALSFAALVIAASYPYFKRFFAVPQAWLGIAFGFGIPMAFAAAAGELPAAAWVLLLANIFWTLAYDTEYAMADREDDLKAGIKSSAVFFGKADVIAVSGMYVLMLLAWCAAGFLLGRGLGYYGGAGLAAACFFYHVILIRNRDPDKCFYAFRHNSWAGAVLFAGIVLDYAFH